MKNSAGRGGCYPPRSKAEVDNILRDLRHFDVIGSIIGSLRNEDDDGYEDFI